MSHALSTIIPDVHLIETIPMTTSINVAACFDKKHFNVLRDIENLDCSSQFSELNFEVAEYLDNQKKPRPMVEMTRDGFTFLVMGFTGAKAAAFKESYIAAFNALERAVRGGQEGTILGLQDELLDTQRQLIDYQKKEHAVLNPPNARKLWTDADRLNIYRLRQGGMSYKEIGREVGRTHESISKVLSSIRKAEAADVQ